MLTEIRQAIRSLRRAPGLAVISIVTVALGIGAGTSLFAVVKAVLLNPLPYPDSHRLMWIAEVDDGGREMLVSMGDFEDWRSQNRSFQKMAAYTGGPLNAGGGEMPQRTTGSLITEDFFETMRVQPFMGRDFTPADHQPRQDRSVIIGHGLWQRAYGANPQIVGSTIQVVGFPVRVAGVMPPGFDYPNGSEIWLPWGAFERGGGSRQNHNFRVIGSLRPGVSYTQAQADLSAIARALKQQYPGPQQARDITAISLRRQIGGNVRPAILMLFGAVGFLLLIVCVNVANLLVVRWTARSHEIALRVVVGASWQDVLRKLLTESLLLAGAGGAFGVLAASWSIDLIRGLLPAAVPGIAFVRIDSGVLAFALAVSTMAGLLFGTLPAWRAARMNVNEGLKTGSRLTAGKHTLRMQRALVVSEVSLSLVLVAGAALLANSFWKLYKVDPGFRADHLLSANVSFPVVRGQVERLVPVHRDVLAAVRSIPGVESAGYVRDLPFNALPRSAHVQAENGPEFPATASAIYQIVSSGFFEALRIRILQGRDFTIADTRESTAVTVINAAMARTYWPGRDPIGQRIRFEGFAAKPQWHTIVGVAADIRQVILAEAAAPQAFVCYAQLENPGYLTSGSVVVRSSLDPGILGDVVRKQIRVVDREAAVSFQTMDAVLAASVARQKFQTQILSGFAVLALLLAAVGLYGMLSYMVTSHRAEIGIRIALGAQPAEVFGMVTRRALGLSAAGIAIGLLGCLAMRTVLARLLYGVGPSDPPTLTAAAVLLFAVALLASWHPARRAMRLDPMAALREE